MPKNGSINRLWVVNKVVSDPKNCTVWDKMNTFTRFFFYFITSVPGWNVGVPGFDVTYTTFPRPICYHRFYTPFFFLHSSRRPVEERMGNSDVINLGTAGQRSMQTLRVPRLVPMCLCPVDGEIDGVVLPACAAPASQHADWSVWSCGMSPSAPPVPLTPSCVNANHWQEDGYLSHVKSGAWWWAICQQHLRWVLKEA